jgi:hypothetical protein
VPSGEARILTRQECRRLSHLVGTEELSHWCVAPKSVAKDIVDKLNAAIVETLADTAVRSSLAHGNMG